MNQKGATQAEIEKYVAIAKNVTRLNPTIVYHSGQSLAMEMTESYRDRMDDSLGELAGFLSITDVLDDDVLRNMQITIPDGIFRFGVTDDILESFQVIEELRNYRFQNDEERYLFAILHEFGHYHDLMVRNNADYLKYFAQSERQRDAYTYSDREEKTYRQLPIEVYADTFALKHLKLALQPA